MSDEDRNDSECEDNTDDATKHGAPPESRKYSPEIAAKQRKNTGLSDDAHAAKTGDVAKSRKVFGNASVTFRVTYVIRVTPRLSNC